MILKMVGKGNAMGTINNTLEALYLVVPKWQWHRIGQHVLMSRAIAGSARQQLPHRVYANFTAGSNPERL